MITIVAQVKFYSIDHGPVEYTCEDYCNTWSELKSTETKLLNEQRQYCDELNGMFDTFYYETYYEVPQLLEAN